MASAEGDTSEVSHGQDEANIIESYFDPGRYKECLRDGLLRVTKGSYSCPVFPTDENIFSTKTIQCVVKALQAKGSNVELSKEATDVVRREATLALKHLIQDSQKFAEMGVRKSVLCDDVSRAANALGHGDLYGFPLDESLKTAFAGEEFKESPMMEGAEWSDNVTDFSDLITIFSENTPPTPRAARMHKRWLHVRDAKDSDEKAFLPDDGPVTSVVNQMKRSLTEEMEFWQDMLDLNLRKNKKKLELSEIRQIRTTCAVQVPKELISYCRTVLNTCFVGPEQRREAFGSLRYDPNMVQLYGPVCLYVMKNIEKYVLNQELDKLLVLIKMVEHILLNEELTMVHKQRGLHMLLPGVMTCIVTKTTIYRGDNETHWLMRDRASKVLKMICDKFSNSNNQIYRRVMSELAKGLRDLSLDWVQVYGCLVGMNAVDENVLIHEFETEREQIKKRASRSLGTALSDIQRRSLSRILKVLDGIEARKNSRDEMRKDTGYRKEEEIIDLQQFKPPNSAPVRDRPVVRAAILKKNKPKSTIQSSTPSTPFERILAFPRNTLMTNYATASNLLSSVGATVNFAAPVDATLAGAESTTQTAEALYVQFFHNYAASPTQLPRSTAERKAPLQSSLITNNWRNTTPTVNMPTTNPVRMPLVNVATPRTVARRGSSWFQSRPKAPVPSVQIIESTQTQQESNRRSSPRRKSSPSTLRNAANTASPSKKSRGKHSSYR